VEKKEAMAKLGEGDDRWIVKDRDDGKNVNGWHWSETNLTDWSKEKLTELLVGIVAMDEGSSSGWCKTTSLEKCAGDVTVQSRKQKRFPLYELEIKIKWEGQLWDENGKVKTEAAGHIKIPDLSEETFDDLEMTVVLDDEKKDKMPLKEAMRTTGVKRIREACISFVKQLKESVSSGADAQLKNKKPVDRSNSTYVVSSKENTKMADISFKYAFAPPPHVMYDTMLDSNRIRGATASDASMSSEVGGKLEMFSGTVSGENVTLEPFDEAKGEAKIVWKWRFNTWQPSHFSTVTLTFTKKDDGSTELAFKQSGVPEEERERTEKGWKGMVFDRLKAMLGGSVLG